MKMFILDADHQKRKGNEGDHARGGSATAR